MLQLLESDDNQLIDLIKKADKIVGMVKSIAEKSVDQREEDGEESEGEVVALAEKVMQLLNDEQPSKSSRTGDKDSEVEKPSSALVEG